MLTRRMAGIAPWGLLALAAAHGAAPQSTGHAVRTVIVVEGTELRAVKVGDVVRLSRSAAAGRARSAPSFTGRPAGVDHGRSPLRRREAAPRRRGPRVRDQSREAGHGGWRARVFLPDGRTVHGSPATTPPEGP